MTLETIACAAALYAIPKGINYVCTNVENPSSAMDHLRVQMAKVKEAVRGWIGRNCSNAISDVIFDNSWIGFVLFTIISNADWRMLLCKNPASFILANIFLSSTSMLVRDLSAHAYPPLRPFIASKSYVELQDRNLERNL